MADQWAPKRRPTGGWSPSGNFCDLQMFPGLTEPFVGSYTSWGLFSNPWKYVLSGPMEQRRHAP